MPVLRRHSFRHAHVTLGDPGLAAEFGDEPAALQGDHPERGGKEKRPQRPFVQRDFPPPPAQPPEPAGGREHDEERGHHQVEEGVDKSRIGGGAGREGVEPLDHGVGIAEGKEAQEFGNSDAVQDLARSRVGPAADDERRAPAMW